MSQGFPKYMMGTTAIHMLGDISRDKEDLCHIDREEGSDYIGSWVTGFGFIEVRFPKISTRDLTPDEIDFFDGRHYRIGSGFPYQISVRDPHDDIGRWADDGGRA